MSSLLQSPPILEEKHGEFSQTATHAASSPHTRQTDLIDLINASFRDEKISLPLDLINAFYENKEIALHEGRDIDGKFSDVSKKNGSLADLCLNFFKSDSTPSTFTVYLVPLEMFTEHDRSADSDNLPDIIGKSKTGDMAKGLFSKLTIAIIAGTKEHRSYLLLPMDDSGLLSPDARYTKQTPPPGTPIVCIKVVSGK